MIELRQRQHLPSCILASNRGLVISADYIIQAACTEAAMSTNGGRVLLCASDGKDSIPGKACSYLSSTKAVHCPNRVSLQCLAADTRW